MGFHASAGTTAFLRNHLTRSFIHDRAITLNFYSTFARRLEKMIRLLEMRGYSVEIISGTRSIRTQRKLQGINPQAARGLNSPHLDGVGCGGDLRITGGPRTRAAFVRAARECGLQTIRGRHERGHIQLPRHLIRALRRQGVLQVRGAWQAAGSEHTRRRPRRHRRNGHHHDRRDAGHRRSHRPHRHPAHRPATMLVTTVA